MVTVHPQAKIVGAEMVSYGSPVIIDDFVFLYAKARVEIGNYVHIGVSSSIVAAAPVSMADFSTLSHGCRIFTRTEDFKGAGFGNPTVPETYRNLSEGPVEIGRFCVVGANSVILPGVRLGEGATVGANSVISRDLEPWGVYIGNRRAAERDREGVLESYERFLRETS